jgi:A/G-specific adenine glycosylase
VYEKLLKIAQNPQQILTHSCIEIAEILKPLGLENSKSRRIKELSEILVKNFNGNVPMDKESLLKLPGVGAYTAAMMLCLVKGEPEPAVDVNSVRLIQRFFGYKSSRSRPRTDPNLQKFIKSLMPSKHCKEFNLALLDFSHKICKVKPDCLNCPLNIMCSHLI